MCACVRMYICMYVNSIWTLSLSIFKSSNLSSMKSHYCIMLISPTRSWTFLSPPHLRSPNPWFQRKRAKENKVRLSVKKSDGNECQGLIFSISFRWCNNYHKKVNLISILSLKWDYNIYFKEALKTRDTYQSSKPSTSLIARITSQVDFQGPQAQGAHNLYILF